MSNIRKIDDYNLNADFSILFPKFMFSQEASGKTAALVKYLLKTKLSYVLGLAVKKAVKFESFTTLEILDEPTLMPLKCVENINISDYDFSIDDLKNILIKKNDWPYLTISNYHEAFINKEITPLKMVQRLIDLSKSKIVKNYNAIVEMHIDEIIKVAKESTERYENDNYLSVVDGVPFCVSENFYIAGYKTYFGVSAFEKLRSKTAFIINKLLNAGAILIGTTSIPGLGANNIGLNTDSIFPSPPNPWNNERYSGGSSTGNAVLLALGLCPFAIGSDIIGSVRVSAGWCGLVGVRPTFSRVSSDKCLKKNFLNSIIACGPMGCCVSDTAIILHLINGTDSGCKLGLNAPLLSLLKFDDEKISNVKFGVYGDYINISEKSIIEKFYKVTSFLQLHGYIVKDIIIPEITDCVIAGIIETLIEVPVGIEKLQKYAVFTDFPDVSLQLLNSFASTLTEKNKINAQKQRTRIIKILEIIFEEIDIILLPTTSRLSPVRSYHHKEHGFIDNDIFTHSFHYSMLSTLSGIPSISINIGYDDQTNLPISLMLMAKWWKEDILFSVANLIEKYFPLTRKPTDFQGIIIQEKIN